MPEKKQEPEFTLDDLAGMQDSAEEVKKALRATPIPFGKHKGRLVKDLPIVDLVGLRDWLGDCDGFDDLQEAVEAEMEARLESGG